MRNQLDDLDAALYMGTNPKEDAPIVLGALRDKMLGLAAERTAGPRLIPY